MALESHKFPAIQPHGAIAFMFPEDRGAIRTIASVKNGKETFTFERKDGLSVVIVRMFHSGNLKQSRFDIGHMGGHRGDGSRVFNYVGPARDKRHGDAAFMGEMFVEPK